MVSEAWLWDAAFHPAFDGQTPDEIYFGREADVPKKLARKRQDARQRRLEKNRQAACSRCPCNDHEELAAWGIVEVARALVAS